MAKSLSQKLSWRLFIWGLILVPFFVVADSVLQAVLFNGGNIREQILFPADNILFSRLLVSIFILGGIYLGMHFLANTSRKEMRLQQRGKDLGAAKQDVEILHEDSYSHLRNSSSELATTLALLGEQCQEIDEKTLFFIEKIQRSSDKIIRQLDINQTLTEQSLGEPYRERVRIDKLACEIAEKIKEQHPDRKVTFTIQPLVRCWCDRRMLRQIIENLFINAMAFIPDTREGEVEFGMLYRNNQAVFFVRDNGCGFTKAQAKRLFEPFRDTTQDPDLPSDTTLLSNTRRIVHRHGGQMWAEGVKDVGGTYFFTYYG
jgi:signal transduction histidine kinase